MNIMDHPRVVAILDIFQDRLNEDEEHFETLMNYVEDVL